MTQNDIIIELLKEISAELKEIKNILNDQKLLRESKLPRTI